MRYNRAAREEGTQEIRCVGHRVHYSQTGLAQGHADRSEVTRLQEELTAQIRINSRLEETIRFLMSSVEKDSSRSRSIVEMQSISEERLVLSFMIYVEIC